MHSTCPEAISVIKPETQREREKERGNRYQGLPLLPNHDKERDVEEDCEAEGELQQPHLFVGQDSRALRRGVIDGWERDGMECEEVTGIRTVKNSDFIKLMLARCNASFGQLFSCAATTRDNQTSPIVHACLADVGACLTTTRAGCCPALRTHLTSIPCRRPLQAPWESEAKLLKAFSCGNFPGRGVY